MTRRQHNPVIVKPNWQYWLALAICAATPIAARLICWFIFSPQGDDTAEIVLGLTAILCVLAVFAYLPNLELIFLGSAAAGICATAVLVTIIPAQPSLVDTLTVVMLASAVTGALFAVGGGFFALTGSWRRVRFCRHTKGGCESCGYDLAGLPALAPCPECGKVRPA